MLVLAYNFAIADPTLFGPPASEAVA